MNDREFYDDDEYDDDDDIEMMIADERQEEIFKWVAASPLAESMEGGSGADFFIRRGSPVRLKDGVIVEAVSWLDSEGFDESLFVEGYTLSTEFLESLGAEVMIFTKRQLVDAPFDFDYLEGFADTSDDSIDVPF